MQKILTFLGGTVLLILSVAFSLVFFVALLGAATLLGGYLWWRTRSLRQDTASRQATTQSFGARSGRQTQPDGIVIEGEAVRVESLRVEERH